MCPFAENSNHQKNPGTIVSWRSRNTKVEDKMAFKYKQVHEWFTSYHELAVTSGDKVHKLNIPSIPRAWHHVTFTWSKAWGLKFYQNGALAAETGRARTIVTSATNPTDGLFIIGNRLLSNEVKSADSFQLQDLTVWPRIVSQAQIKEQVETGRDCAPHDILTSSVSKRRRIYRGYYKPARGCKFYLRVFNSIFHKRACNILFLI